MATVHGVEKNQTQLSAHLHTHTHKHISYINIEINLKKKIYCPCNMKNIEKRELQSKAYSKVRRKHTEKCFCLHFTCGFNNDLFHQLIGAFFKKINFFFASSTFSIIITSLQVLHRLFQVTLSYHLIPNSKPDFKLNPLLEMAYQSNFSLWTAPIHDGVVVKGLELCNPADPLPSLLGHLGIGWSWGNYSVCLNFSWSWG